MQSKGKEPHIQFYLLQMLAPNVRPRCTAPNVGPKCSNNQKILYIFYLKYSMKTVNNFQLFLMRIQVDTL